MGLLSRHKREKAKAEQLFKSINTTLCPYFKEKVIFNSDGFNHLQFSAGRERPKSEQLLKFNLLPFVNDIVEKSGTIQEYRKQWGIVGRKSNKDNSQQMKEMQYWGLIAIVGENKMRIRVVLRRVGDGHLTFWSVMLAEKLKKKSFSNEGLIEN